MTTTPGEQYLLRAIEHAPRTLLNPIAKNLRGWWLTFNDGNPPGDYMLYVCAECAARIMDRGCHLLGNPEPVWNDRAEPFGVCVCCHPSNKETVPC